MPEDDIDLLLIDRGAVTAPAGCGKTHLIADALTRQIGSKPILVLTHTNAGVVALRGRLSRAGVSPKAYRLFTIDGWIMRLIATFPTRSGHNTEILKLANPATDYLKIREGAFNLLKAGHISDILKASYSRILVDEYQDCSIRQHYVVVCASQILPTCVLGDPLQAIFGFGKDNPVKWEEDVYRFFPFSGELSKPWRWINAGAEELGHWLIGVRRDLLTPKMIDLRTAPAAVTWVELDGSQDYKKQLKAAQICPPGGTGHVLIIGESKKPDSQRQFASQTPGAVTVEAVDLKDFVLFAKNFDLSAPDSLEGFLQFAQSIMTNVGVADLLLRVRSLSGGSARKPPTNVEKLALAFLKGPSFRTMADLLIGIIKRKDTRAHRPTVLKACIRALQMCDGEGGMTFHEASIRMREQYRILGRSLPKRAVGSTLLLKGLEAEVSVILDAGSLDARNLYVAMTRGSKALTICSQTPCLPARF